MNTTRVGRAVVASGTKLPFFFRRLVFEHHQNLRTYRVTHAAAPSMDPHAKRGGQGQHRPEM